MKNAKDIKDLINNSVRSTHFNPEYEGLYAPLRYSLNLNSKRVRPILCILAAQIYSEDIEAALDAALGIEFFHTFTLIHDDIMDDAELRRGSLSVYKKDGINTAILSGDVLYTLALQQMESYPAENYKQIMSEFNLASKLVCEGQQLDMDFEQTVEVSLEDYLLMIRNKTAVLAAAALKIGAIIGGASESDQRIIYEFGINTGMTFQLMDDYLDTYGDESSFGKKIGGDIMQKKKSYLLLKSLEDLQQEERSSLLNLLNVEDIEPSEKVERVKEIYSSVGADKALLALADSYHKKNNEILSQLSGSEEAIALIKEYVNGLLNRNH